MAQYGQILQDIDYNEPVRNQMYNDFSDYFNQPMMSKTSNPDSVHSMYMCKAYCLLSNECRYIIAIIKDDKNPIGTEKPLKDLKWVSIQTRTLPSKENIRTHGYQPKMSGPLTTPIIRNNVQENASIYSCQKYPITVTMLHTLKKTADDYQPRGNIIAALETYNTIVTIN